ncbi:MAG: hypothetical protein H7330_14600 [Hymenobacteraceae bacterium]|nr:hypothetical protein [Hymenobacteraceae bacterium]
MNASEYKAIGQRPDVFSRPDLEDTIRALSEIHPVLSLQLAAILTQPGVSKPDKHSGDSTADFFRLELSTDDAETITDLLGGKEAESVGVDGNTTPAASYYARFVDLRTNYLSYLNDRTQD